MQGECRSNGLINYHFHKISHNLSPLYFAVRFSLSHLRICKPLNIYKQIFKVDRKKNMMDYANHLHGKLYHLRFSHF